MAQQMEATKIADGVRGVLEFIKSDETTIMERITILRSTADLLNQIIIAEATAASMIATFRNIYEKK